MRRAPDERLEYLGCLERQPVARQSASREMSDGSADLVEAEQPAIDRRAGEPAVELVDAQLAALRTLALDVERAAPSRRREHRGAALADVARFIAVIGLDPLGAATPADVACADHVRNRASGIDERLDRMLESLERVMKGHAAALGIRNEPLDD